MTPADLSRSSRFHSRVIGSTSGARSDFRRDRDRILYSVEFQRLTGVTQVASPTERFPVHNRLTHTLKVAQVGRSIAEQLLWANADTDLAEVLNPDVVEAACLAHDLGHPPFGHNTERELDAILTRGTFNGDGFEGNAQTFRIVTTTSVKYPQFLNVIGLNLTAATLNALLKYPWSESHRPDVKRKWGHYGTEQEQFDFARSSCGFSSGNADRSIEAEVMNLADDISYAVHDVEDFVRVGLIPSDVFVPESAGQSAFLTSTLVARGSSYVDNVADFLAVLALDRFSGRTADFANLAQFRSRWVDRFIASISTLPSGDGWSVSVPEQIEFEIDVLKQLTRYYVIDSPAVQSLRYGQRRIVREVFEILEDESTSRRDSLLIFAPLWKERMEQIDPEDLISIQRSIADYISSMTEMQLVDIFQKLTGQSQGSVTDPLL